MPLKKKKKMKLRLTVDVTYEGDESELWDARACLWDVPGFAFDRGMLTGNSGAEVEGYDYNVEMIE
jgi:hypothetical protein